MKITMSTIVVLFCLICPVFSQTIDTFAAYYLSGNDGNRKFTALGLTNISEKTIIAFQGKFEWYDELENMTDTTIVTLESSSPYLIGRDLEKKEIYLEAGKSYYYMFDNNSFIKKSICVGVDSEVIQGGIDKGTFKIEEDINYAKYLFTPIKILFIDGTIWLEEQ